MNPKDIKTSYFGYIKKSINPVFNRVHFVIPWGDVLDPKRKTV